MVDFVNYFSELKIMNRTGRLMGILTTLQAQKYPLADQFGISVRTVYRDIRDLDIPVAPGNLYLDEDPDLYVVTKGESVNISGSMFRAGLSVGLIFGRAKYLFDERVNYIE